MHPQYVREAVRCFYAGLRKPAARTQYHQLSWFYLMRAAGMVSGTAL